MLDNGSSVEYDLICAMVTQMVKHLPAMRETRVQSLGREDLLEKELAIHSTILAWWAIVHRVAKRHD